MAFNNKALLENLIETQLHKLGALDDRFIAIYTDIADESLRKILSTIHVRAIELFNSLNERIPDEFPTHFWADPSRGLLLIISIAQELERELSGTEFSFEIEPYYADVFTQCMAFLSPSGGSQVPVGFKRVRIPYKLPLFTIGKAINVTSNNRLVSYKLHHIGGGSYADVYKYRDDYYGRYFALKKSKRTLQVKEVERFRREFDEMFKLNSPYVLEVYKYFDDTNEYIMEHMDITLHDYILKNNGTLSLQKRKSIVLQVLKAFEYIHSKNLLHRDISPKNILLKLYEDIIVVKVSDFGLVKIPDSTLTSKNTEYKGYFNDPGLLLEGFSSYAMWHETFALTRVVYFVLTGRMNTEKIDNNAIKEFVAKGLSANKSLRYADVTDIRKAFLSIDDKL